MTEVHISKDTFKPGISRYLLSGGLFSFLFYLDLLKNEKQFVGIKAKTVHWDKSYKLVPYLVKFYLGLTAL